MVWVVPVYQFTCFERWEPGNWDTDHGQVVPGYLLKGWEMGDGCHWPRRLETGNWEINHGNGGRQFLFNRSPVRGMGDWRLWTWSRHLEYVMGN